MYKLLQTDKPSCLQCGCPIYGRTDKRFCSIECKNAFHNREAGAFRKTRNYVLDSLDINYSVLKDALRAGLVNLPLSDAIKRGFRPEFTTHYRKRYRREELGVYDIRYDQSGSRIVNIHRVGLDKSSD